jgi:hypothetical protein
MSITPTVSFTTIGNLSDGNYLIDLAIIKTNLNIYLKVLKELPIVSTIGYNYNNNTNIPLINTKQQFDYSNELLNSSNDQTLIQELANALIQIDSSNMFVLKFKINYFCFSSFFSPLFLKCFKVRY